MTIASWLSKPIQQRRSANVELASAHPGIAHLNAGGPQTSYVSVPSKAQSAPEILGVIPERKNEEI
jgi:hypothetical protein